MDSQLKAPFPWFGGKRRVAHIVWDRLGDPKHYIEPFAGSLAVLLARPHEPRLETVNDLDGYVCNFWRAVQAAPEEVARWADWPVDELDLSARHLWLLEYRRHLASRLAAEPSFFEPKIAGWWVWGISQWIGAGWCSPTGPWQNVAGDFIKRTRPGIPRHLPAIADAGHGVHRPTVCASDWMKALSSRLRRVRVCCGDWQRVLSGAVLTQRPSAILLDPPYAMEGRDKVYENDDGEVFGKVRAWAFEKGADPTLRIALCGYDDGVPAPEGWECVAWKATGGFGNIGKGRGRENASRERIWFSPGCLSVGLTSGRLLDGKEHEPLDG